jgi:hypothetical protein
VLRVHKKDQASAVCGFFFSPFVSDGADGADEQSIWYYWLVSVLIMLVVFAQDEVSGMHCKNNQDEGIDDSIHFIVKGRMLANPKLTGAKTNRATTDITGIKTNGLLPVPKVIERPKDALPMVRIFFVSSSSSQGIPLCTDSMMLNIIHFGHFRLPGSPSLQQLQ